MVVFPICSCIFIVIKAHKPEKNYPMRIIVSTIGTPTYTVSQYLVKIIQPMLNKNTTRLKNSREFVNEAKNWNIDNTEVQCSYGVVNLYPSIPIKESIEIILEQLQTDDSLSTRTKLTITDIKKLLDVCLSDCYYLFNNDIHYLQNSGPIGLALMVIMAESFLQYHGKNAHNTAHNMQPPLIIKSFKRYVDDSHARFINENDTKIFLDILKEQHQVIKYTIESEDASKSINFLDVNIKNDGNGKYEFKIHRKNAITNVQIKPTSNHDTKIIQGLFKGYVERAFHLCSPNTLNQELQFLTDVFEENGYQRKHLQHIISTHKKKHQQYKEQNSEIQPVKDRPNDVTLPWLPGISTKFKKCFKKAGIQTIFKSGKNINQILTAKNKPKLPLNSYPAVYKLDCSCGKSYAGETKLQIKSRINQHFKTLQTGKWDSSGLSSHARNCHKNIDWYKNNTLSIENKYFDRKVRESLEIRHNNTHHEGMNLDGGNYVTTNFWEPMFKYLRHSEKPKHC